MLKEIRRSSQLVSIEIASGVNLDGLLIEPSSGRTAALLIHGKGGNFYTGPGRFIPELSSLGDVCHLSINMRCHDLGYTKPDVPISLHGTRSDGPDRQPEVAGGMWELLADGREDLRGAVGYLRDRGYGKVFLIGHSSGAFYAADYAAQDPDIAGRLLLSPLVSNKAPLELWFPTEEALEVATANAREMVAAGQGHCILTLPKWYYGMSAASLLDRLDEDDDAWMKAVSASPSPLLMIWGSAESRHPAWSNLWNRLEIPNRECHVIEGSEHFYLGFEHELASVIDDFIERW